MNSNERVMALVELLNSKETDLETGKAIISKIESAYNCFGSYAKISEGVFKELSESGKKRFACVWALAGMELAYSYLRNDFECWDDRKKASEKFAYDNIVVIDDFFRKNAGFSLGIYNINRTEAKEAGYFYGWFWNKMRKELAERKEEWYLGVAEKWTNVHSTNKQSFFGGCVSAEIFAPDIVHTSCFPFI